MAIQVYPIDQYASVMPVDTLLANHTLINLYFDQSTRLEINAIISFKKTCLFPFFRLVLFTYEL